MEKQKGKEKRLAPLTVSTLMTSSASVVQESTDQPQKGVGQLMKNPELSLKFGSSLSLRTLGKCYSWGGGGGGMVLKCQALMTDKVSAVLKSNEKTTAMKQVKYAQTETYSHGTE